MITGAKVIRKYEIADLGKRIDIICKYYPCFMDIVTNFIEDMEDDIKEEQDYNRRTELGDLGVRVQTSGLSNPTQRYGVRHSALHTAILTGNFSGGELDGVSNVEDYLQDAALVRVMIDDYGSHHESREIFVVAFVVVGGGNLPSKTKKPCTYPGCPALVTGRYCEEHARKANSDYEKFSRDKNTKRRYGRAWKRIRDKYAAEHPYCERCFARGVLVPVEEIHHKLPLAEGGTHERSNLIALCKSCHSQIHAKRGDR